MAEDKGRLVKEMLKFIEEEETKFGESQNFKGEYINPFNELGPYSDGIHYGRQHLLHAIRMTSMIVEEEIKDEQIIFKIVRVDEKQRMVIVTCTATLSVEEQVFEDKPMSGKGQALLKQIYSDIKAMFSRK